MKNTHPLSKRFWSGFLCDERGQSTTEYILMLAVVVMIAMKFKTTFKGQLEKIMGGVSKQMDEAVSE